jgi:hypothetical protein
LSIGSCPRALPQRTNYDHSHAGIQRCSPLAFAGYKQHERRLHVILIPLKVKIASRVSAMFYKFAWRLQNLTASEAYLKALEDAERFELLARLHGYNEMAKKSEILGEKAYCRIARDHVESALESKYGVKITRGTPDEPTLLTLGHTPPYIKFSERDIEMMRRAVADYDTKKVKEPQ